MEIRRKDRNMEERSKYGGNIEIWRKYRNTEEISKYGRNIDTTIATAVVAVVNVAVLTLCRLGRLPTPLVVR